jgi:BirA family transcriptional regulator, biotin operon repressor / biotin---[acetyl-CoA-carboxylase] ligase
MANEIFNAAAAGFPDPFRLLVRDSVTSTNDELRMLAQSGAPDGLILLAEQQTAGRGRRGAAWFSPTGESLAFSILLRPVIPKSLWPRYSLATGLAVAEAIETCGLHAGIKWPNDVWIARRKAAGILVEAGQDFVIIGIGLNVSTTQFPPEVKEIATSLRMESSQDFSRAEVLSAIVRKFAIRSRQIDHEFCELIAAVRQRCVLSGNQVSLITSHGLRTGVVEGIAEGGELLLRTATGLERIIQADEVRLLPS